jgi:hypothetical protein
MRSIPALALSLGQACRRILTCGYSSCFLTDADSFLVECGTIGDHHFIPLPVGQILSRTARVGTRSFGRGQVQAGLGPELPQER